MAGRGRDSGRGRGGMASGLRPVSEAGRIDLMERLQKFRDSPEEQMTFEAGLSNHDRAVVHDFCKKMGFKSKSHGKGNERRLSVYKSSSNQSKAQSKAAELSFSSHSEQAIHELFLKFPPVENEEDSTFNIPAKSLRKPDSGIVNKSGTIMSSEEISKQVTLLSARIEKMPAVRKISEDRAKLPITAFKNTITSAVEKHQVVLIAGETGCGKTTQVPQFILDTMWSQGKPCKVICTQPRRISAISVADRIATERGESVGESIGYQIRLEAKVGPRCSLLLCTNGILLRKLVAPDDASADGLDATHVIVDEIHERDCNADFLLVVLKDLLSLRPDLHVILMSATLDTAIFSAYFGNCPVIQVPGFTFPVQVYYLEDILAMTNSKDDTTTSIDKMAEDARISITKEDAEKMDAALTCAWSEDDFEPLMEILAEGGGPLVVNYQHSLTGATALMIAAGKGRVDDVALLLSLGADWSLVSKNNYDVLGWAKEHRQDEVIALITEHQSKSLADKEAALLGDYHKSIDQEEVDILLIQRLLCKLCTTLDSATYGAILIFFPGWEDITRCKDLLLSSHIFGDPSKYLILPLHSMIPMIEQKKIFHRPPHGVRKIILATNIAETAITIDDIVYVIDSGRIKEKSYDPYTNVSTFQTAWISKASSKQREGRAGRCQPGVCYHMFSKVRAAALPEYQVPEMKRTPLEEICLKVKLLQPNAKIRDFLSRALDPPVDIAIQNAIQLLVDLKALTDKEELTEIGQRLGPLPVHPATAKMLMLAILLNCLDPALTLAAAEGCREPFVLPMAPDRRKHAVGAKQKLASRYGGYSDHFAVIAAFDCWREAKRDGQEQRFCSDNFISSGIMIMLDGVRRQLRRELLERGFLPANDACNVNAHNAGIIRAVLTARLYPLVGIILPPLSNGRKGVVQTAKGEKVRIHPQSSNFRLIHYGSQKSETYANHLLAFDEITRGEAQVYVRNSTLVKPHPLLFICSELVAAPLDSREDSDDDEAEDDDPDDPLTFKEKPPKEKQLMDSPDNAIAVVLDRWLRFRSTSIMVAQVYCLRQRLMAALAYKIKHPHRRLPDMLTESVHTLAYVLSCEGVLDVEDPFAGSSGFSRRMPRVDGERSRFEAQPLRNGYREVASIQQQYVPVRDLRTTRIQQPNASTSRYRGEYNESCMPVKRSRRDGGR